MSGSGGWSPPSPFDPRSTPFAPHALETGKVARRLGVDPATGLAQVEAERRLAEQGRNELPTPSRPPYLRIAGRQLTDPLVLLLVAAAVVSVSIGDEIEGAAIAAIVFLNGMIGFVQEARAERAVLSLGGRLHERARVIRDGVEREIAFEEVVRGDLAVIREGDKVPADGRIVGAERLEVDESALTGESAPLAKDTRPVDLEASLADRTSLAYAGTGVTRGHGTFVVTETGAATEMGCIASLTAGANPPATPLERRLAELARWMVVLGVVVTLFLAAALAVQGASVHEAFLVGVAVAVATVPEGLAATVTIALALGAQAMASRGAITRRLSAVETLGSASVIATDKTGTLTQNRMRVARLAPADSVTETHVLEVAALASTAELLEEDGQIRVLGDPVEGAILIAARDMGIDRDLLLAGRSALYEVPFQPERRRMAVVYPEGSSLRVVVKGAPEVVFADPGDDREARLRRLAAEWGERGLRVLAVGERRLPEGVALRDDIDLDAEPVGLVALDDPLRETAAESLATARKAGLSVRMLTGDHPATAMAIGRSLGLGEDEVHARVTPEEKLHIVESLQADGEVVAVTGDGVNDAPALRRGDIGVAMGRSGTQAAREAADLVLTDDDFRTIVAAVEEGRRIAANVRKFVAFLLSANLGELVLFASAILAGLGAPLTVVQVLLVNVVTDGLPAIALARDPVAPGLMRRGPASSDRLLPARLWLALAGIGLVVGAVALSAYTVGGAGAEPRATTMAFATVALSELALVFGCRSATEAAWRLPRNPYLIGGVLISLGVVVATLYVPALQHAAGTVPLSARDVALVAGLSAAPVAVLEAAKAVYRRFRSSP